MRLTNDDWFDAGRFVGLTLKRGGMTEFGKCWPVIRADYNAILRSSGNRRTLDSYRQFARGALHGFTNGKLGRA